MLGLGKHKSWQKYVENEIYNIRGSIFCIIDFIYINVYKYIYLYLYTISCINI